ncbi:MAG: hypothetical protein ACRDPF_05855 [Streptosporangiaceae bacterium]
MDTMLRDSPRTHPSDSGGLESERTTMGNVAVAEELAGSDELDELYRLDASEPEPEPEPDEDEGDEDEGEGEGEEGIKPEGMPHD